MIPLSEGWRSLIGWLVVFFAYELAAAFKVDRWVAGCLFVAAAAIVVVLWPITTFSGTVWDGIKWWAPLGIAIFVITYILLGHFELHWRARYLILSGVVLAMLIVWHVFELRERKGS